MFRVRWEAHRQARTFAKFRNMELAAAHAAQVIARTNGPLMLRITLDGRTVYDFERIG